MGWIDWTQCRPPGPHLECKKVRGRAWALVLLDGNEGGSIVGELAVREELASRHWRGRAVLQVLSGGQA